MVKYIVGVGALLIAVVGYFVLAPGKSPPVAGPEQSAEAPSLPDATGSQTAAPVTPDEERLLENMAADFRENLPSAVTDRLTMTDAVFLPQMRIMEYSYVLTGANASAAAAEMRSLIQSRAETTCLEGQQMFEMGVTLRNSFEDTSGNLFQRVYFLPEDCQRFY